MSTSELFLAALLIIYALPYLVWRLGRTDYYAPLVVVQIIGGIILGPGVVGAVFPAFYHTVFMPQTIGALNGVAWWAVMLFVWVAGLELDLRAAWADRRETGMTAALALGCPLILGSLAALILVRNPLFIGPHGVPAQVVLGMGMACAVTALPILVLFMEKLEILRTPFGQRILRYASLDDVAIWAVLAAILLDWTRVGRQLGFLAGFALASALMRRVMPRLPAMDRWYVSLVWLAGCGYLADWSGLHFMVGAFLAGAVMDADWFDQDALDAFRRAVLLAFMPVFFLSTGLRTSWQAGGLAVVLAAALLLVASVAGKLIGVALAGRIFGWPRGQASLIGWLLQTKALIMIIFTNVLLDKGIISAPAFTALLLMAVGSTMLSIPMAQPRLHRISLD